MDNEEKGKFLAYQALSIGHLYIRLDQIDKRIAELDADSPELLGLLQEYTSIFKEIADFTKSYSLNNNSTSLE